MKIGIGPSSLKDSYDAGRFCFLFLDVKGFTGFSEDHDAPTVVSVQVFEISL